MSEEDDRRGRETGLQPAGTLPRNRHERRVARREERLARKRGRGEAGLAARVLTGAACVAAAATGHWWILLAMVGLTGLTQLLAGLLPLAEAGFILPSGDPTRAHIGMGSTVEDGAIIEPGARVDMGATVQRGALVKAGAIVGMGVTVQAGAIIEENAVIGWGATVGADATVGSGAMLGAGSTVCAGAVVPANARIGMGSTVAAGSRGDLAPRKTLSAIHEEYVGRSRSLVPTPPAPQLEADPREVRIRDLCDRLEAELAKVSGGVGEFLHRAGETVVTVRRTCEDLFRRERDLRLLANPADQERLDGEVAALRTRIAAETDDVTRRQLQGAVDAMEEHRRQRTLLLRDANRLEAEQTRLVWTMEGLLAQVVRLRTTEATSLSAATSELDQGLARLRDEVSSVSSAIEHVTGLDSAQPELSPFEPAPAPDSVHASRTPVRS